MLVVAQAELLKARRNVCLLVAQTMASELLLLGGKRGEEGGSA